MVRKPALLAALGVLASVLCAAVGAHGQPGQIGERGQRARGGFQDWWRPAPFPEALANRGDAGGTRYGYRPPPFAPPRYPPPPAPRPPNVPAPGWRGAPRQPPGVDQPGFDAPRMASLGWVIESIGRRSPGRQLDSEVDFMDGRPVYRVLWLTVHGRRVDYLVDAQTGVILNGH